MARGGARPGAGRKAGTGKEKSITAVRKTVAEKIIQGDITPLEVMVSAMRAAHEQGDARGAAYYAQMAAPYVHPRLSNVSATAQVQGQVQLQIVSEFSE